MNSILSKSFRLGCCTYLRLLIAAVLLQYWLVASADDGDQLPELGDSDTQIFTPNQEKEVGQQFVRQLLAAIDYIDDPELNAYLNRLGTRVAKKATLRGTKITVYLIKDSVLNAFAVPGGHITFHTGLVLATADESELASVMAHEIAHISQRHLPRLLAKKEAGKLPAAAAVIGSILIGGKEGVAGLTLANASLLARELSFSREFEREADSIGIRLLNHAGFDSSAMARFFYTLDRYADHREEVPEFLRTHPLSFTRIAEAENRSGLYPGKEYQSNRKFYFAKAKIRALYTSRHDNVIAQFASEIEKNSGDQKDAAIYGTALIQMKERMVDEARATLKPLLAAYPDEVPIQLAQAAIEQAAEELDTAISRYKSLVDEHPDLLYLNYYYIEASLANEDAEKAKRAVRHQLRRHKDMYLLYPLLSRSNGKLGLLAEAHQATAEYHVALGDYTSAIESLKNALREASEEEGYLYQSINARLMELEGILELKQLRATPG